MNEPVLRTRPPATRQPSGKSSFLTSTAGHGAAAAQVWLTEPSSNPASGDRPRVPSTRSWASLAAVISIHGGPEGKLGRPPPTDLDAESST